VVNFFRGLQKKDFNVQKRKAKNALICGLKENKKEYQNK
jgi:hypothetical protein